MHLKTINFVLMVLIRYFFPLFLVSLVISSCYRDNEEELYPKSNSADCDTGNVTYNSTVKTIIDSKCKSCHSSGNQPDLSSYSASKTYISNNTSLFLSSIKQTGSAQPMPPDGSKLPDCDIKKIEKWIQNIYPEN